jgi:hypothetical protein
MLAPMSSAIEAGGILMRLPARRAPTVATNKTENEFFDRF